MRWLHAFGLGGIALALVGIACSEESVDAGGTNDAGASSSSGSTTSSSGAAVDAGPDVFDAGPALQTVKIHVTTPSSTFSRGGPVTPTWAVQSIDREDGGSTWVPFLAKGADAGSPQVGEYEVTLNYGSFFTIAFACANDKRSLVSVLTRAATMPDLDVELATQCGTENTETTDLTGTFTGLGANTGWLDFGYAFDSRGAVFPTNGGTGDYELVNVVSGTWDLAFGIRDDFGKPFTKILLVRDQNLPKGTATLDANVGASPNAFVPGTKKLTVNGSNGEQTNATVLYTMTGATTGLDIAGTTDYATIPAALQKPTDRYRISAIAKKSDTEQRGGSASFYDATDVTIDLPAAIDAPKATVQGKVIVTSVVPRTGVAYYEATVFTAITNQSSVEWRVSTPLVITDVPDNQFIAPPDFTGVSGFKSEWLTPLNLPRTVTIAAHEPRVSVSDGTLDRFAQHSITMDSP